MSKDTNLDLSHIEYFQLGEYKYDNNLKEHLSINDGDLNGEFASHAELFAWYATNYELALHHELVLKEELQRMYARVDAMTRDQAFQAGKKLTEKMVENTVITNPNYVELHEKYLKAKRDSGLWRVSRDAMIHRKDMLVQMGANYRAEGSSDLSMKMKEYESNFIR